MPPSNEEERGRHRGTPRGPPGGGAAREGARRGHPLRGPRARQCRPDGARRSLGQGACALCALAVPSGWTPRMPPLGKLGTECTRPVSLSSQL